MGGASQAAILLKKITLQSNLTVRSQPGRLLPPLRNHSLAASMVGFETA